ncbi:hypothetical protein H4R34_001400 [Dimargaris verticillata]|uniref:Serine carboxypeptidase n=1 Tax=Dimargaris verticillata TaxID=2761393 RepID=A0A9W8BAV2_9FUNG|nr:hypothetical protein H4R34_001400 [Dimargaris verticillata]
MLVMVAHCLSPKGLPVHSPTLCDPNVQQYSGYLNVGHGRELFYWFFERSTASPEVTRQNGPVTDTNTPITLWLNGGPGCSSLFGLFKEMGPCHVDRSANGTYLNPRSWHHTSHMLFVDQPFGTGWSKAESPAKVPLVDTSAAAAQDMLQFLYRFYDTFPQYRNLDFHIFGQSYSGKYIPALATTIVSANQGLQASANFDASRHFINLRSIGIGNGWVNPLVQM